MKVGPTIYNKDDRITAVVTCITIGIGLGMLIGPLWWLQHATSDDATLKMLLGIITVFIFLFTVGNASDPEQVEADSLIGRDGYCDRCQPCRGHCSNSRLQCCSYGVSAIN